MGEELTAVHVIDFEGHLRYGVVEYGVATLTAAGIVSTATELFRPTGQIFSADIEIHGIDPQRVEGLAPFSSQYDRFVGLRRSGLFCAHNAMVEHNLLRAIWAVPPFSPLWGRRGDEVADWGPWLDTLKVSRRLFPERDGHSLGELSEIDGIREDIDVLTKTHCPEDRCRPHAALYDAVATAVWLYALYQRGAKENFGDFAVGLLELTGSLPQAELF